MEYEIAVNNTAVYADNGTIQDNFNAEKVVTFLKRNNLWSSCVGLWMPQSGLKKDGNQLVSKMYDVLGGNHLEQSTGAKQLVYSSNFNSSDGQKVLKTSLLGAANLLRTTVNNFTVSVTFRINTTEARDQTFISRANPALAARVFNLYIPSTNDALVFYISSNGIIRNYIRYAISNFIGNIYVVSCTWDGTDLKMYLNGQSIGTQEINFTGNVFNYETPLSIGNTADELYYSKASIGIPSVLNTVFTDSQALAYYNQMRVIYGL